MPASHPKQSEHSDSSSENASAVSYFPQKAHIDIPDWSLMSEKKKIALFNAVLEHYREPGPLQRILPRLVIPDTTNRGNTGLSVEHVHWVASKIQEEGFMPRTGSGPNSSGHDLPIVVRESTFSDFGPESLLKWQRQLSNEPGFAPLRINEDLSAEARAQGSRKASTTTETCSENDDEDCIFFFGSLGNGHFFQVRRINNSIIPMFVQQQPCVNQWVNLYDCADFVETLSGPQFVCSSAPVSLESWPTIQNSQRLQAANGNRSWGSCSGIAVRGKLCRIILPRAVTENTSLLPRAWSCAASSDRTLLEGHGNF